MKLYRPAGAAQRGFTIVELMVVCSILVLLMAILLPGLTEARIRAQEVVCGANLRTLGMSCIVYAGDNQRLLPDLSLKPGTTATFTHTYWGWQDWRKYMEGNYGFKRDTWYSPTNPRWNRDGFYFGGSEGISSGSMVMGYFYWTSGRANSDEFYNAMGATWTTAPKPTAEQRPLFARRLSQTTHWNIMWTDLNRQWPATAGNNWVTPGDADRYGANHMYESRYEDWPRGSHVLNTDGSLEWQAGEDLRCRAVFQGTKYYW
ncbi:MAG: prepilin-type N-terminal cleavage/methylation domain-containing protein [Phycisphaera sp.]|nr:prepilin-type N-terminal cleavage/methylation domain-containing protein [Phycisphaera sp.]